MRFDRLPPLGGLLVAAALSSCVDGGSPVVGGGETASLLIVPVFQAEALGSSASAPGVISRIRITARLASNNSVLATFVREVDPNASEWTLDLEIPVPEGGGSTVLTLELMSVTDGAETVEWSGRSAPIQLTPGQSTQAAEVPVVRGPTDNLGVTGIVVVPDSARIPEGTTVSLDTQVSTDGTVSAPQAFWSALDANVSVDATGTVTGLLPGVGRVAVRAGAHADTARIVVDPVAAAVTVAPDSVVVTGLGQQVDFAATVRDPRGGALTGYDVAWTSLDSLVAASLGGGRFLSRAAGRARVVARVVQNEALQDTAIVVVNPPPFDVAVRKTTERPEVFRGDTVTFLIEVANVGEGPAGEVVVRDPLPDGLEFVGAQASTGSYRPSDGAWSVGLLPSGSQQRLTLRARIVAAAGARIVNTVRLVGVAADADPNPTNNEASAEVGVFERRADLALTKVADRARVRPGEALVFTVGLRNLGPHTARSVVVEDLLPDRFSLVESSATNGRIHPDSLVWRLDSIPVGATFGLRVAVRAGEYREDQEGGINVVGIRSSGTIDPDPSNNRAEAGVFIDRPRADIAVQKIVDRPTATVGDTVKFRVVVVNRGPGAATGVRIRERDDTSAFRIVGYRVTEGSVDTVAGIWTVGRMESGKADTLELKAAIREEAGGRIVYNRAWSMGLVREVDPDASNDTATVSLAVDARSADLRVTKAVDRATAFETDTLVYTVVVTNGGPGAVDSVVVLDSLTSGVNTVSHVSKTPYDAGQGRWSVGALSAGQADTLTLRVFVPIGRRDTSVDNVAVVSKWAGATDPDPSNNRAAASTAIQGVDVALAKTVSHVNPSQRDTITYVVKAINNAAKQLTNLVIRDSIQPGLTLLSHTASNGTYDSSAKLWTLASVAPNATDSLVLKVQVDDGTAGATIRNEAQRVSMDQSDTNPPNDVAIVDITVKPVPVSASYATMGNTDLRAGPNPPALSTAHVQASGGLLAGTPSLVVTSTATRSTVLGGSVTQTSDGSFRYTPPVGTTAVADTFHFVVENGDSARVVVELTDLTWYVRSDAAVPVAAQAVAAAGSGTASAPFATLADAISAAGGSGRIFLYSGAQSYQGGVALGTGQELVGEGVAFSSGPFTSIMPAGTPPVITNGSGDGVTLGDGSKISGVTFDGVSGKAVVSTGSGGGLTDVAIKNGGAGILLSNASGAFAFTGLEISGTANDAFRITKGNPSVTVSLAANGIQNQSGRALQVDSTSGGSLTVDGGAIKEGEGLGVLVLDNAATVEIKSDVEVASTTSSGLSTRLAVVRSSAAVTFHRYVGSTVGNYAVWTNNNTGKTTIKAGSVNTTEAPGVGVVNAPTELHLSSVVVHNDAGGWAVILNKNGGHPISIGRLDVRVGSGSDAVIVDDAGTVTVSDVTSQITSNDVKTPGSSGIALKIVDATVDMTLASLTSTNASGRGVLIQNSSGSLTINGGSISNAAAEAFVALQGDMNIVYAGSVNTGAGGGIKITQRTGGTASFTGPISVVGNLSEVAGIEVSANASTTTTRFSGMLTLDTQSNPPFYANSGGMIEVTGAGSALTSTTASAVQIYDTEIGPNGVTFRSTTSSGAAKGIDLFNVSGSGTFEVTGTGTTDGSGGDLSDGTIGVSLVNVGPVTLKNLTVDDNTGDAVVANGFGALLIDNLDAFNDARGVHLTGAGATTTIRNSELDNHSSAGVDIDGLTGGPTINVHDNTIVNTSGGPGVLVKSTSSDAMTVSILGNSIADNSSYGVRFEGVGTASTQIGTSGRANAFAGNGSAAIFVATSGATQSDLDAVIDNNTFTGPAALVVETNNPLSSSTLDLVFTNNTATASTNTFGEQVAVDLTEGINRIRIADNTLGTDASRLATSEVGISASVGTSSTLVADFTITGNAVNRDLSSNEPGIEVDFASSSGTFCTTLSGNDLTGSFVETAAYHFPGSPGTMRIGNWDGTVVGDFTVAQYAQIFWGTLQDNTVSNVLSSGNVGANGTYTGDGSACTLPIT